VSYEGISFSYDEALASEVVSGITPAEAPEGAPPEWSMPEHIRFSFNGYALTDTFHEPRIMVFSVSDFEAMNPTVAQTVADLQQLLVDQPAAPDSLPFVPVFNAAQMIRAQVAYLDFQSGAGVRFLSQYGQAVGPINNSELFYTFQGLTDDGSTYVSAILPVSNPVLPADGMEVPGGDYEAFAANFETYLNDIVQQLNAQPASSFTPDLLLLDTMIQSLLVQ
jgi:hypothetical protein